MDLDLTFEELQILPELATLEVLAAVLQTTIRVLHAAHSELYDNENNLSAPGSFSASAYAAEAVIHHTRTLMDAIDRYELINYHRIQPVSNHTCSKDPF